MDISSRRIQQSPASIASPDCFGFLHKLGARWHQWKRRYCVLKDACLYLYHDTDATQAIGTYLPHTDVNYSLVCPSCPYISKLLSEIYHSSMSPSFHSVHYGHICSPVNYILEHVCCKENRCSF